LSNPYAAIDREPIWAALMAKLKSGLGTQIQTIGRRHISPPELSAAMQPAVFVIQVRETKTSTPRGLPGKLILQGFIFVYCATSGASEIAGQESNLAATQLNALKKAIDDAIAPDQASGIQSLGGLVSHCWIDGDTDEDPGIFGQQAMAVIPVNILC
jgi:hypothetical protein